MPEASNVPFLSADELISLDGTSSNYEAQPREEAGLDAPPNTGTPSHSMIVIDETTRFEGADYHLTTQDCAPRESQILCQVFKDGALVTGVGLIIQIFSTLKAARKMSQRSL